jgi:hypothetical protein
MANYIHNENQRLLWKMVHQIPAFANLDPPKKDFEFKNVVENIYRKNAHRNMLNTNELQQLNRETLSVFLPKTNQVQNPTSNVPPIQMVESRQDKSLRAFQERQNVYEQMNKKPELPSPDIFLEKDNKEEKIQNMDSLIYQYQKQREIDYNTISPPVILPASSSTNKMKLKLLEETILPDNDIQDLTESKKKVSWNKQLIQLESPKYLDKNKISMLENKIKELEKRNEFLENRMNILENLWRENNNIPKRKTEDNKNRIIVHSVLHGIIAKIERMDHIKNKIKNVF